MAVFQGSLRNMVQGANDGDRIQRKLGILIPNPYDIQIFVKDFWKEVFEIYLTYYDNETGKIVGEDREFFRLKPVSDYLIDVG